MSSTRAQFYLATLRRRRPVSMAVLAEALTRAGAPLLERWCEFHEAYAGYEERLGPEAMTWGLLHDEPDWLDPGEVSTEDVGAEWVIACADGHPSFGYELTGRHRLAQSDAENGNLRVTWWQSIVARPLLTRGRRTLVMLNEACAFCIHLCRRFEHLVRYCSKFEPLPAIGIVIEGTTATIVRGHKYLLAARALGRPMIRAVVLGAPTQDPVESFVSLTNAKVLDWEGISGSQTIRRTGTA